MFDYINRITDPRKALDVCRKLASDIQEDILRAVAMKVLDDNAEVFLRVKGSDWQHHNYAGGLIVHICNVTLTAKAIAAFYEEKVNKDMVVFCALMHDVGKTFDYKEQEVFPNENNIAMNQALLGHSLEGVVYITDMLRKEYKERGIDEPKGYVDKVITQVSHCIGAHMDCFGACAKQQMFEVMIIGCADKVDAYIEGTVVKDNGDSMVLGNGETFYKAVKFEERRHRGSGDDYYLNREFTNHESSIHWRG